MRTIHQFQQGSAEWLAHRARIFNASEAAAVMGASKYMSRSELLRQKATGIAAEVDASTQARFDRGHAVEGPTVAMIEDIIEDQLAPVVASIEIDGLTLGASYDGLSMLEDTGCEIKLWNEELAEQVRRGELDPHYYWQLEHQFIVTPGLERIVFATSDGTPERFVSMEYRPQPGRREQLLAGWRQFAQDLAAYQPPESTVPKLVAEPVEALPAVVVQVSGQLTVQDNFRAFEERLRHFLDHQLIRQPQSDQDFADLDAQIKAMKDAERALDRAEEQMLAQVQTIDQAKRTKDMLAKLVRDNRLMAEKLLAAEKERRRGEIVAAGVTALRDYVAAKNKLLGKPYMPSIQADFGGVIKGKKSLASMEDAVAGELARAKIEANATADRILANLGTLRELAAEHAFLFADTAQLVLKAPEDCRAMVESRIAAHREQEARKEAEQRERIRAEEAAKLAREQEAREREIARQAAQAAAPALPPAAPAIVAPAAAAQPAVANVVPMPARTAPAGPPTLKLGDINARLAPLSITAEGLKRLGFEPAARQQSAVLYHQHQLTLICDAAVAHLRSVQHQLQAA